MRAYMQTVKQISSTHYISINEVCDHGILYTNVINKLNVTKTVTAVNQINELK